MSREKYLQVIKYQRSNYRKPTTEDPSWLMKEYIRNGTRPAEAEMLVNNVGPTYMGWYMAHLQ